jgi:hypothetical protein
MILTAVLIVPAFLLPRHGTHTGDGPDAAARGDAPPPMA